MNLQIFKNLLHSQPPLFKASHSNSLKLNFSWNSAKRATVFSISAYLFAFVKYHYLCKKKKWFTMTAGIYIADSHEYLTHPCTHIFLVNWEFSSYHNQYGEWWCWRIILQCLYSQIGNQTNALCTFRNPIPKL